MKFTLASCLSALAAVAVAKPQFTNSNLDVVAGQPFTLTWSGAKGPVTIELKAGSPPNGLKTYKTLATGVTGTSQTVTLTDIPSGQYAFAVRDGPTEDDTNYSAPFPIQGTSASVSGSSSVASTAASTTSPASTSANSTSSSSSSSMTSVTTARNSTASTSSSSSSTATRSTPSASTPASSTPTGVPNNNSGGKVQSSLALVLLGAAAYVFLN